VNCGFPKKWITPCSQELTLTKSTFPGGFVHPMYPGSCQGEFGRIGKEAGVADSGGALGERLRVCRAAQLRSRSSMAEEPDWMSCHKWCHALRAQPNHPGATISTQDPSARRDHRAPNLAPTSFGSLPMTSRRSLVILSGTKNLSNNLAVWWANPRGWTMEHQSQRGDPSTPLRMTRIDVLSTFQSRVARDPLLRVTNRLVHDPVAPKAKFVLRMTPYSWSGVFWV
jgi:hypothetical protein